MRVGIEYISSEVSRLVRRSVDDYWMHWGSDSKVEMEGERRRESEWLREKEEGKRLANYSSVSLPFRLERSTAGLRSPASTHN